MEPLNNNTGAEPNNAAIPTEDAGSQALSEALSSSFVIVRVIMVALVIVFFSRGCFSVGEQEQAIILRLGKPLGEGAKALLGPGIHFALPAPIDEVVRIPKTKVQTANSTIGWYATTPELEATHSEPPAGPSLNPAIDSYVLTGDSNIIHVRAGLQYRVTDPVRFKFDFTDAPAIVTNALNEALLFAAAKYSVDNALTKDVVGFRDAVQSRVTKNIDDQQLGIAVEQVTIETRAPRQLKEAFDRVLQATAERETTMNQARTYQAEVLNRARSDAAVRVNLGETDRTRLVESLAAEAQRFENLAEKYAANPRLFFSISQTETLQRVLTNVQEKVYLPYGPDGKQPELRLKLSSEPPKPSVPQLAP